MANANTVVDDARHLQVFKLEGRRNKMDFIRGFPGVANRFGITGIIYDGTPKPGAGDENAEARNRFTSFSPTVLKRFVVPDTDDFIIIDIDIHSH